MQGADPGFWFGGQVDRRKCKNGGAECIIIRGAYRKEISSSHPSPWGGGVWEAAVPHPKNFFLLSGREMRILVHSRALLSVCKLILLYNMSRCPVRLPGLTCQPDCGLVKGGGHYLMARSGNLLRGSGGGFPARSRGRAPGKGVTGRRC